MIPHPKFYVDDIVCSESGQPVLIGQLVAIQFFQQLFTNDRQKNKKITKIKCNKHDESAQKQFLFIEYNLLYKKHLGFADACSQQNSKLYRTHHNQINTMQTLIHILSIEFKAPNHKDLSQKTSQ